MKKPEKKELITKYGDSEGEAYRRAVDNLTIKGYNQSCDDHDPYIQSLCLSEETVAKAIQDRMNSKESAYKDKAINKDIAYFLAKAICKLQGGEE